MNIKVREPFVEKNGIGKGKINYGSSRIYTSNIYTSQVPMMENSRYVTGLDRFDPSIAKITDEKKRKDAIAALVKKRENFEQLLGISLNQETPEGKLFWDSFEIDFNQLPFINEKDPKDQLLLTVVKANMGDPMFPVASSKEDLGSDLFFSKDFYIEDEEKELSVSITKKERYMRAMTTLSSLYESDTDKLYNIASCILPSYLPIKRNNIPFILDKMTDYLDGKLTEETQMSCLKNFLETANLDAKELDLTVTVMKAIKHSIISKNQQHMYYNRAAKEILLGRTIEEVKDYFRNDENQDMLGLGKTNDRPESLKAQLKKKELI